MAIHNFNYTYTYQSCKAVPKSIDDDTLIVREVTIEIVAVDQADPSQSITLVETTPLDYLPLQDAETLPDSFIPIDEITNQQMVDWFLAKVTDTVLDGYFTWQLYGADEVDPVPDGG